METTKSTTTSRKTERASNSFHSEEHHGRPQISRCPANEKQESPSLNKAFDRNRLSGFLYNISMYLQDMSAELDDRQQPFDDDQFWENLLYSLLQTGRETSLGLWDGKSPPRPTFRLQDLFVSLRGSPHWDGLLGLVQSILTLTELQPQKPILTFISQNWKTISALLETVLQALVSGTYGQAVAGLQGFICVLKGRNDCAFNLSWLEQIISFMETKNWKPVVSLLPVSVKHNQKDAHSLRDVLNLPRATGGAS